MAPDGALAGCCSAGTDTCASVGTGVPLPMGCRSGPFGSVALAGCVLAWGCDGASGAFELGRWPREAEYGASRSRVPASTRESGPAVARAA